MTKKFLIASFILISTGMCNICSAQNTASEIITTPLSVFNKENLNLIKNNSIAKDILRIITYTPEAKSTTANQTTNIDMSKLFKDANEKFAQGNITAAYKDYQNVINAWAQDDFINIGLAYKFSNMGLFTLAQEAINNITERELYNIQIQLIKSHFFPQVVLSYDDEIKLAQNYTEIYYNNLAFEVARDMNKNSEQYKRSDYAHYILSQAYYNIKEYNKAINEINKALSINPDNLNYLKYKSQIYCEINKYAESLKILDAMLADNLEILDFKKDIESLRYYTLAKAEKDRAKSKYYLANYFYIIGEEQRAIKELNQNITSDKKDYKSITKLANIYAKQNKLAEAMDLYEKSYKIKKNDTDTLLGIANMYLYKKDYKNAANFYLKALRKNKKNTIALINLSYCYKMSEQPDKAAEFADKAFANKNISGQVYYVASKIDDIKEIQYLKKAVATNPLLTDAWLALAEIALKNKRPQLAELYLKPINYIDKKDYKYYYFLGLAKKQQGQAESASLEFKKALQLNPLFVDASKELNSAE